MNVSVITRTPGEIPVQEPVRSLPDAGNPRDFRLPAGAITTPVGAMPPVPTSARPGGERAADAEFPLTATRPRGIERMPLEDPS